MSYTDGFNVVTGSTHAMRHMFDGTAEEITGIGGDFVQKLDNNLNLGLNNTNDPTI